MAELLPCPFCGSIDIDCADAGYKTDVWFVQCNNCCTTFPHFDSKEEAIIAWNTRTPKERGGEK
jgi:Lar family restriction alleviation protein